ncbi:MAG: phosphatase [Oscillospiraceae bacterium]|nr:phosphatase [Oscillospiraceae bacterium]
MNILTDTHCHTIASTHAYSTVCELAAEAKNKKFEAIAVTDHGTALPDSPHIWHFVNLRTLPQYINGVRILKGCEVNILDDLGGMDMPDDILSKLDIVIASIHHPTYKPKNTTDDHTLTYLHVLDNPGVDIIGHSGWADFQYNHEKVLTKAKSLHKLIEINSHTFSVRKEGADICRNIALECKRLEAPIVVSSDAHICFDVGNFNGALKMLAEIDFPEELIVNTSFGKLADYLSVRKNIR